MAAIRIGVTPVCIARCFVKQTGKPSRGSHSLSDIRNQVLLQTSHLHTLFGCSRPPSRAQLSRRRHGRFVWVNAAAVRHNSSQIPPDEGFTAAPVEVHSSPPVLDSSSVSLPADVIAAAAPEQITAESLSMATSAADTLTLPAFDPGPALTPPLVEQVAEAAPTAADVLQAVAAEPRLVELGLGNYTPVGLLQNFLESIHLDLGLPWWGAIVLGTVLARLAMFPVVVKGQRESVKMNNVLPQLTKLSKKVKEANLSGNLFEFSKAYRELKLFKKKHDLNPLRNLMIPAVQVPVFLSFFFALRQMTELPVPSLQTGGTLWFTDLTAADPLYILPLVTTGSMFFIMKLGADTGVASPHLQTLKMLRIVPFIVLPFIIKFPTALFTYWVISNSIALIQVVLLRHPAVRKKLRIPDAVEHPESAMSKNEGLIETMRKTWTDAQRTYRREERERRLKNHLDFAAKGPLRQTFTHNPLKQAAPANPNKSGAKAKQLGGTIR